MYFDVSYACVCVYELNNIHGRFVETGSSDSASFLRSAACTCLNEGAEVEIATWCNVGGSGSGLMIAVIELLIKPVN